MRRSRTICLGLYMLLLAAVSLLPGGEAAPLKWDSRITPIMQDIGHVLAYAILVLLALGLARASHRLSVARAVLIFVACCGLGALLEVGQWFIPGRTCSPSDALANVAGVAAGVLLFWAFRGFRTRVDLPIAQDAPSTSKARVCMLVTNDVVDDPRVLFEAEALAQAGYGVTVIGWDRTADADHVLDRNGFRIVQLKLRSTHGRGLAQPFFLAGFWLRAWPVVRQINPQVIHCHDLDTLPLGRWASRRLGAKLVFDAHENYPDLMAGHLPGLLVGLLRRMERRLVPRCSAVITVGQRLAAHFQQMRPRRVVVVGNWKDSADFVLPPDAAARKRSDMGLAEGAIAVCFIANLGPERRVESLLRAIAGVPGLACVVGGDGPQAGLVRKYAQQHSNIRYLGHLKPAEVGPVTAACDVVYCGYDESNLHARWGAPNKLFEAIAAGKPILSGDYGELGDIVRQHDCGVLVDTTQPAALLEGLRQIAIPEAYTRMSSAAANLRALFSRRQAAEQLVELYDSDGQRDGEAQPELESCGRESTMKGTLDPEGRNAQEAAFWDKMVAGKNGGSEAAGFRARYHSFYWVATEHLWRLMLPELPNLHQRRVLLVGCGTSSHIVKDLAARGADVWCLDISPESIRKLMTHPYGQLREKIHPAVGDAENMPFDTGFFNVVVGRAIVHHLDIPRFTEEMIRVCAPGATFVFSEPLGVNPLINLFRRLTPAARVPTEHPLVRRDIEHLRARCLSFRTRHCFLLALGSLPWFYLRLPTVGRMAFRIGCGMDRGLFAICPPARWLAWSIVLAGELRSEASAQPADGIQRLPDGTDARYNG